jgi:hypothetical protein
MSKSTKVYVVTAPAAIRGIYDSWDQCKAITHRVKGAKYQGVESRAKAQAMLDGDGIVLAPGLYAFTDGNAAGGVGVVIVDQVTAAHREVKKSLPLSVELAFGGANIRGLETDAGVAVALGRLNNILTELGGLFAALAFARHHEPLIVVYDYKGIGHWMQGTWQRKDPVVDAVIEACHRRVELMDLDVTYRHQRGHQSTWAGRDDFAYFNGVADKLATQAAASRAAGEGP